jgi:hypothetical protein
MATFGKDLGLDQFPDKTLAVAVKQRSLKLVSASNREGRLPEHCRHPL